MSDFSLPLDGSCRCGNLKFRISEAPLLTNVCHCKNCQRMTGGPFSVGAAIPASGFTILQGDTAVGGSRSPALQHNFCPQCMSWVFTRPRGVDTFVNVRTSLLDENPSWIAPFVEFYPKERQSWVTIPVVKSMDRLPNAQEYKLLAEEFRKHHSL